MWHSETMPRSHWVREESGVQAAHPARSNAGEVVNDRPVIIILDR